MSWERAWGSEMIKNKAEVDLGSKVSAFDQTPLVQVAECAKELGIQYASRNSDGATKSGSIEQIRRRQDNTLTSVVKRYDSDKMSAQTSRRYPSHLRDPHPPIPQNNFQIVGTTSFIFTNSSSVHTNMMERRLLVLGCLTSTNTASEKNSDDGSKSVRKNNMMSWRHWGRR